MKKTFIFFLLAAAVFSCSSQTEPTSKGKLLIVGGRAKPPKSLEAFIDHVGDGKVLVIPSASGVPLETGPEGVALFKAHGACQVDWIFIDGPEMANADSVVKLIDDAAGIFFTGGVQSRLMNRLGGTASEMALHRLYAERGGIIGGTSAGAAVQSDIMITGDGDWTVIRKDSVKTAEGFGFFKDVIIDQHFVKRHRNNRLMTLAIETGRLCIGIDESTAIMVHSDRTFDVYGIGSIIIYDAREADRRVPENGGALSVQNLKLSVLRDGQRFDMKSGRIIE